MRKIGMILIILSLMVIMAVSLGISVCAECEFQDVKEGSWFYDAVNEAVEAEVFNGTSKYEFSPHKPMTREMFVTTLARLNKVDVSQYTSSSFSDVKVGEWYAPYVEWAYRKNITDGIGGGKFGVNKTITRQEMVALFYKSAADFGENTEIPDQFKYDRSYDKGDVAEWAVDGMKWALANFIISGTGNVEKNLVLSPSKTATRAEAAQLIVNYLDFLCADEPAIGLLSINGNPIDMYKIIYADNEESKNAANELAGYIERCTGVTLDVQNDSCAVEEYEILIGKTNREDRGIVTTDRVGEDRCSYEISVQGNYLVIAGKDDKYEGSYFGVIGLCEEVLGFGFYTRNISTIEHIDVLDIPDGYCFKDGPGYESRSIYWSNCPEENKAGSPFKSKGFVHNLPDITGVSKGEPCLTDPAIIEYSINAVKGYLKKNPNLEIIWVSQNDSADVCVCESCNEVNRQQGSRGGTIMMLCNAIAEAIEEEYPDCQILTLAYLHTTHPINSKLDDSVIIYYCTMDYCLSHDYADATCPLNAALLSHMTEWNKICKKIWVWDYSANFTYSFAALPMVESLRDNKAWFYSLGVRGEFNNAILGKSGEFGSLTAYLTGILQWDPNMSVEEYQINVDKFLEAYYGAGWKYIRKYIDAMELLSDKNHFSCHATPQVIIDYEDLLLYMDEFEAYWDAAEALAKDENELDRIQCSRISWTYTMLTALYTRDYCSDDYETQLSYVSLATEFVSVIKEKGVKYTEKEADISFDPAKPPHEWFPAA